MTTMRSNQAFRLLALAAAASAWALVAVGGIVRVTESGLGCPDWPLCEGRVVPEQQKEPMIETSHRWVAGLVTVLVPVQALLGAIVVWLELPGWIVGVHFVVGMLFLAATVLAAGAAWRSGAGVPASEGFVRLAWWTTGAGLVLVALGAAVVSADADPPRGESWPDCNGALAAGGADAWLQVAHRSAAYVVAGLAVALAA